MESYLYSSWESAAPFETDFQAKVENSDHLIMLPSQQVLTRVQMLHLILEKKNHWILGNIIKKNVAQFVVRDVVRKDSTPSDVLKDGSVSGEDGEEIVGVNE